MFEYICIFKTYFSGGVILALPHLCIYNTFSTVNSQIKVKFLTFPTVTLHVMFHKMIEYFMSTTPSPKYCMKMPGSHVQNFIKPLPINRLNS